MCDKTCYDVQIISYLDVRDAVCRQAEEQEVDRTNSSLHGFQQQLVDCVSKGQNHIVVAPTGSGKTRVAVELAGLVFARKPAARILFLTPTVALAEQQTGKRQQMHIYFVCFDFRFCIHI